MAGLALERPRKPQPLTWVRVRHRLARDNFIQNLPRLPIPDLRRIHNPCPIVRRDRDPVHQHKHRQRKVDLQQRFRRRKFVDIPVLVEPVEPALPQIAQPFPQRVGQTARLVRHLLPGLRDGLPCRLPCLTRRLCPVVRVRHGLHRRHRLRLHRKQRVEPCSLSQCQNGRRNLVHRVASDNPPANRAVHRPAPRPKQPHVVVDFRRRRHRRARIPRRVLLPDRNRWRQPVDQIDIRLLDALQKLPCIRRQRLHIPPLSLRIDRVERQRRLPRPGHAGVSQSMFFRL